jgi:CTP:molybdopterin cytidylyltransferase MocA
VREDGAETYDVVVLAGTDDNPRRLIEGQNKAFLPIHGKPLVRIVVEALLDAARIDRVIVVGPRERLDATLDGLRRVRTVAQVGRMMRNAWAGVRASAGPAPAAAAPDPSHERPLMLLTCDIPLISGAAIDDFIERCLAEEARKGRAFALHCGIVEERALKPYYPAGAKPGIVRPYVEIREGRYRLANIYFGRPHGIRHQDLLDTGFNYRKAKDWRNVLRLAWTFLGRSGGWRAMWFTLRLQATLMAAGRSGWLYRKLRSGNTERHLEGLVSELLGGPINLVETPYGGLSLDADEEEDYRVLAARLDDWGDIDPTPIPNDRVAPAGENGGGVEA